MDNKQMKSIDEMAENLSDDQQKILEQFRNDMTNSPVRNLLPKEREIYASAIMRAIELLPSFRDALAVLSPFMDATNSTAYTDKYARVGLSYWFFYLADRETRAVAILHESMHILYNHFPRFSSINVTPMQGNIAGDLEINSNLSMLPKVKTILKDFVLPDNENMNFPYYKTMEQYNILIKDKIEEDKKENGSDSGSDGNSQDSSDSEDGNDSSGSSGGQGQHSSSSGQGNGQSSQGSSGNGQPGSSGGSGSQSNTSSEYGNSYDDYVRRASGEKPLGSPSLEDMMKDNQEQQQYSDQGQNEDGDDNHPGDNVDTSKGSFDDFERSNKISGPMKTASPSYRCDHSTPERMAAADEAGIEKKSTTAQNIARRNTKARIVQESKSRAAGSGSSNDFLKVAAALMDPPKVDWRTLFRRAIAKSYNSSIAGKSYTSYKRVNRRSQGSIIFPGTVDYQPTAMFGIDTSGSMGKTDYENLLSEIEGIMKNGMRSKDALRTFCVDTDVKNIEFVKSVKNLKLTGGGGTEMAAAFRFVNSLSKREQPDIFVLGTDGGLWEEDWKNIYNLVRQARYTSIILITSDYGTKNVPDYVRQVAAVIDVSESEKNLNPYN